MQMGGNSEKIFTALVRTRYRSWPLFAMSPGSRRRLKTSRLGIGAKPFFSWAYLSSTFVPSIAQGSHLPSRGQQATVVLEQHLGEG
jgi:hypothetical protein